MRAGALAPARLDLAARCGHEAARRATGAELEPSSRALLRRAVSIGGREAGAWVCLGLARQLVEDGACDAAATLPVLEAVEGWLERRPGAVPRCRAATARCLERWEGLRTSDERGPGTRALCGLGLVVTEGDAVQASERFARSFADQRGAEALLAGLRRHAVAWALR